VPAPQITPPTPTNPSSGIDWDAFLEQFDNPLNIARTFLEVSRPIPVLGLFTGMAADGINMYQDLDSISKEDAPFTKGAIVFRDVVMIINNVLGSLSSLDQWVQDAATGSVVFVEADAVTAPVQEALKTAKLVCDGIQLSLDVIIAASAQYNASKAPDKDSAARWNGLLQNYQANILGDTLTTVIDVIDVASAGAGNAENAKQAAGGIKAMVPASKVIKQVILSVLQGWFGIYGGGLMPGAQKPPTLPAGGPAAGPGAGGGPGGGAGPAVPGVGPLPIPYPNLPGGDEGVTRALDMAARQAASALIRGEIGQMKSVYTTVDTALGVGGDILSKMMTEEREKYKALLGGKDPLRLFVTTVSKGLDNLNKEVTNLLQMGVLATSARERAEAIIQYSDQAQTAVDSIRMPRIQIPRSGDGGLLDAAAELLQTQVVDRLTAQAQRMIDDVKKRASAPIAVVKGNAKEIAEFSVVLQQTATSTVTQIQARIASFSAAFARCNSLEDIINVIISQTFQALGLGEGFTVDDIRKEWAAIGPALDDADEWAASLANPAPGEEQ